VLLLVTTGQAWIERWADEHLTLGRLLIPQSYDSMDRMVAQRLPWGCDNGAWTTFNEQKFLRMLDKVQGLPHCHFVSAPDVVRDAPRTLELFETWAPRVREFGVPVALVAQDGLEQYGVPWDNIDALFVGGSNLWKTGEASEEIMGEARRRGLWVHVGRVNGANRFRWILSTGVVCSVDGSAHGRFPLMQDKTGQSLLTRGLQLAAAPVQDRLFGAVGTAAEIPNPDTLVAGKVAAPPEEEQTMALTLDEAPPVEQPPLPALAPPTVVILLSGGLDSATLLAEAVDVYGPAGVACISAEYGQLHAVELACAEELAGYYGVEHRLVQLPHLGGTSALLGTAPMPDSTDLGELAAGAAADAEVPFRNGVLVAVAVAWAYALGARQVWLGAHMTFTPGAWTYPDTTPGFVGAMAAAAITGTGGKVQVLAPLQYETKTGVVERGLACGAPYHLTISCYRGQRPGCGTCPSCVVRAAGFAGAGAEDPTVGE
jgi:7-cyano-7-deazaguanine synthase